MSAEAGTPNRYTNDSSRTHLQLCFCSSEDKMFTCHTIRFLCSTASFKTNRNWRLWLCYLQFKRTKCILVNNNLPTLIISKAVFLWGIINALTDYENYSLLKQKLTTETVVLFNLKAQLVKNSCICVWSFGAPTNNVCVESIPRLRDVSIRWFR